MFEQQQQQAIYTLPPKYRITELMQMVNPPQGNAATASLLLLMLMYAAVGDINYICIRKRCPGRRKAACRRKRGPQDLTIAQYVDDLSFLLVGVHLFMLATSNAMQICI